MRRSDIEALGRLGGAGAAAVATVVEGVHLGIASRPFGMPGPAAVPARGLHDGVSRVVYGAVRRGLEVGARGAAAVWAMSVADEGPALSETRAGAVALAAVNGLYGDWMHERDDKLALTMEVRGADGAVLPTPSGLAAAFPAATARIAVFIHGLGETDRSWRRPSRHDQGPTETYGERLGRDLGYTPLFVRYNTGRHISENGHELDRLLSQLQADWPVELEQIVLVGHSMGGLVARGACHEASARDAPWAGLVTHVFALGTPHLGADLEKALNASAWALRRMPETEAFGALVNARSAGIKDLRFGSCVEADWRGHDPDELLHDHCLDLPHPQGVRYGFIAAQVRDGIAGTLIGDLLVRVPSAFGRGGSNSRHVALEVEDSCVTVAGDHFDLLNHPSVFEQIRAWLTRPAGDDS